MGCAANVPDQMRRAWACPDLGLVRPAGSFLVVRGSNEEFPDCPAYYLRTSNGVHLIDGAIHPAELAGMRSVEVKNGGVSVDALTPKALEAALLYGREDADHEAWDREQRKGARHGS